MKEGEDNSQRMYKQAMDTDNSVEKAKVGGRRGLGGGGQR